MVGIADLDGVMATRHADRGLIHRPAACAQIPLGLRRLAREPVEPVLDIVDLTNCGAGEHGQCR